MSEEAFKIVFALIIIWSIPWKGWALWRSARNGSKAWFITLFLFNTLAILDILYLFVFSQKKEEEIPIQNPQKIIPPKTI